MSVRDIVRELRRIGASCRKARGEDRYTCTLSVGENTVKVEIDPYSTKIRLTTDYEGILHHVLFKDYERDATDALRELRDLIEAEDVDVETVWERGRPYEAFTITFDTSEADPRKIARMVRNIVDKDIWVDIRARYNIIPKKGQERFESVGDLAEELIG